MVRSLRMTFERTPDGSWLVSHPDVLEPARAATYEAAYDSLVRRMFGGGSDDRHLPDPVL